MSPKAVLVSDTKCTQLNPMNKQVLTYEHTARNTIDKKWLSHTFNTIYGTFAFIIPCEQTPEVKAGYICGCKSQTKYSLTFRTVTIYVGPNFINQFSNIQFAANAVSWGFQF